MENGKHVMDWNGDDNLEGLFREMILSVRAHLTIKKLSIFKIKILFLIYKNIYNVILFKILNSLTLDTHLHL